MRSPAHQLVYIPIDDIVRTSYTVGTNISHYIIERASSLLLNASSSAFTISCQVLVTLCRILTMAKALSSVYSESLALVICACRLIQRFHARGRVTVLLQQFPGGGGILSPFALPGGEMLQVGDVLCYNTSIITQQKDWISVFKSHIL